MLILLFGLGLFSSAGAGPLMTEEYPLWVRDAVLILREKGLVSAGSLPHQTMNRRELTPLFQRWLEVQDKETAPFASREELGEIRLLLETLQADVDKMSDRIEPLEDAVPPLERRTR